MTGAGSKLFAVKKTRTGLGLVAQKPIPKGKRIVEYFGPLITNEEVDRHPYGKYFFGLNKKWSLDGSSRDNIARYANHSCKPNAEAIISHRYRVWIYALKRIKPGEEITYDYGEEYFEGVIKPRGCGCLDCASKRRKRRSRPKSNAHRADTGPAANSDP